MIVRHFVKRIILLCLSTFVVLLTLLFYVNNKSLERSTEKVNLNQAVLNYYNDSINFCLMNFNNLIGGTGEKILDFETGNGTFSSLINSKGGKLLVLRIKEENCHLCVEHELNMLRKNFVNMEKIVILYSFSNSKILNIFLKRCALNIACYKIKGDQLQYLPKVEALNMPYFFIVNAGMKISCLFVPDKSFSSIDHRYLQQVNKLL